MATYSCAAGYSLNGNAERTCNSDGTWSLDEPTCTCDSPPDLLNGLVEDDGETASYTCSQGYSMNGAATRTCGADGTGWSGTAPTCSTCDTLSTPSGGSVVRSTDGLNTQAAYTCNNGYTLNGVNLITCRNDGSWDFTEPTCARCPDWFDPDSGTLTMSTSGIVTTATFSCLSGYYLKGEFSITCGTDGTWSDDAPSCKCNFPMQPSNGQVTLSSSGTVATYTCDTGYTLNGLSARTCQDDGTGWEGSEPVCTQCQSLSNPTPGSFSLNTNGTVTTAVYACAVGTSLAGENQIMCNADGSWKSTQPTCVECPTLSYPDSGSVSLSTSGLTTTAEFSCVTGYTINSTSTLTCLSSEAWDLPLPFCICQSPSLVSNGGFNISADLLTVSYTCNIGYVLVGSVTRTCQNDGTGWDGISPVCDTVIPVTETPKDGTVWTIPIAAMIIVILIFVVVVILLIALSYLYCRLRKKKSKIGSEVNTRSEKSIDTLPEELPEPKPTGEKASLLKKYNNTDSRPNSSLTTTGIIFANGPPALPARSKRQGKVQLPPISHVITEKRGKKRTPLAKPPIKGKGRRGTDTKANEIDNENDINIIRAKTPDLLHAAEFNYIQPVYSYELDLPPEAGRESVQSKKEKKTKPKKKKQQKNILGENGVD